MQASLMHAALLLWITCGGYAQAPIEKPAFDVASIKPMEEPVAAFGMGPGGAAGRPFIAAMDRMLGRLEFRPGNVGTDATGITVHKMILEAYRLKPEQLMGEPEWLQIDRFQLQAKAEGAGEDRLRLMLQTLLAERFHLVAHHETRRMPVSFLVPAKSGPKLREWNIAGPIPKLPDDRHDNKFIERGSVAHLAEVISGQNYGVPIVDRTGIQGNYLFFVGWDKEGDFFAAMRKQLGLTLKSGKAPIDILVIDRIDQPDAN